MLTLTQDQARSMILRQHGLVEPHGKPIEAMRSVFAVQTQYAASLPMALAVRTQGMRAGWHQKDEHREIVKSWTLRHTLHAQSAEDHDLFLAAAGDWMFGRYVGWMKRGRGFDRETLDQMLNGILEALADGPLTRPEIHERVPVWKDVPFTGWGIDVMGLAFLGKLKLLVADGGATQFALHQSSVSLPSDEALVHLMRRYFAHFGPATFADFVYWSGLQVGPTKSAFEEAKKHLIEVRVEGMKGSRWVTEETLSDEIPRVRLLAKFDPLTMGHRDKSLFLDDKHRTAVIRIAGQVEATVLVDGKMAGTWRINRKGEHGEIAIEPFRKIAKARRPGIEREARKIGKALGLKTVDVLPFDRA